MIILCPVNLKNVIKWGLADNVIWEQSHISIRAFHLIFVTKIASPTFFNIST